MHFMPAWAFSLPSALLLMGPFDRLASLAMDVCLPVIPDMPAALHASPATVQLPLSVYLVVLGLGPMLGASIAHGFGWRAIFVTFGVVGCVAIAVLKRHGG